MHRTKPRTPSRAGQTAGQHKAKEPRARVRRMRMSQRSMTAAGAVATMTRRAPIRSRPLGHTCCTMTPGTVRGAVQIMVCCSAHHVVHTLPPLCLLAAPAGAGLASRCKLTGVPLRVDCTDRGRPALRQARTHHRVQHASRSANTGSRASSARGTSCAASLRASLSLPPKPASPDGKRTCEQGVQHDGAQGASCSAGVRASCFSHPQALLGSNVKA